ncbi:MAG: hypothetical protein IPJ23_11940 [Ignavibacteriales bacterium]|nr:hypothetical protein [Ignavibacteriales bacterium]
MKSLNYFFLIITLLLPLGCESNVDSILPAENSTKVSQDSPKFHHEVGLDVLDYDDVFIIQKEIDGIVGGHITLDTVFTDWEGNLVTINADITFEPNSFSGTKNIAISPDPSSGSIKFSPAIAFNIPAKLNLNFSGINLSSLGFDANSTSDFVYRADDGTIEFILKNECKIKWNTKQIYVKNAELPHFSRYIFVRKSL